MHRKTTLAFNQRSEQSFIGLIPLSSPCTHDLHHDDLNSALIPQTSSLTISVITSTVIVTVLVQVMVRAPPAANSTFAITDTASLQTDRLNLRIVATNLSNALNGNVGSIARRIGGAILSESREGLLRHHGENDGFEELDLEVCHGESLLNNH
jgi:hypothetical protein